MENQTSCAAHCKMPECDPSCDPKLWTELPSDELGTTVEYECNACGYILSLDLASSSDSAWIEKFDSLVT